MAAALATDGVIEPSHLPETTVEVPASRPLAAADEPREPEALRRHLVALLGKPVEIAWFRREYGIHRELAHRPVLVIAPGERIDEREI